MSSNQPMPFGYNTHRPEDREEMLSAIGVGAIDSLFSAIPKSLAAKPLNLPAPLPEWALEEKLNILAAKNSTVKTHKSYLGGGAYEHYIPAVIDAIVSRGEFLTSYTPYQPEISQGLLQALYEYQSSMAELTGLPVVNGSCYDGATALADAAWACCLISGKKEKGEIALADGVWPHHSKVVKTYMRGRNVPVHLAGIDQKTGRTDLAKLEKFFSEKKPAGFLFQTPNALGIIEDTKAIADLCKAHGVVSVCSFNPIFAALFKAPGSLGIDIATCDGQPLGIPLSAGGPSLGVFSTRREYRKYVPGRLVGKVTDINGNPAYALVFEDREQHVARERATSNICSNQALNALRAVIYLASIGGKGMQKIAGLNANKAKYLAEKLCGIKSVSLAYTGAFFNEFTLALPKPAGEVISEMRKRGIFAGIETEGGKLLVAVTEVKSRADLDAYIKSLREVLA